MDRLGVDKAIRAWQLQGQAANMGKRGGKTWRENMAGKHGDFTGFHGEQWEID